MIRALWGECVYDKYEETKTRTRKYETTNWKKGQYLAIGRIAHFEGGGSAGWKAAMNIALDSLKLGNHWLRHDGRAKRVKFLYFDVGMDKIVSDAWAINETWRKSLVENPTQPSDGKAGASASSKDKSTPSNKGTSKGAGKQTGSPDEKKTAQTAFVWAKILQHAIAWRPGYDHNKNARTRKKNEG